MTPDRYFGVIGVVSAGLAVGLGAFGAHALKARLSAELLAIFETGVRYQMYHGLALIGLAALWNRMSVGPATWAGWSFVAGSCIFSGTLYLLALSNVRWLGAITPIGGVGFLVGWSLFAWGLGVRQ